MENEDTTTTTTTPKPIESNEHSLSHITPVFVITGIFGAIFIFFPLLIRKGPNKELTRICIMLSAACCWIFYLTTYIVQMNPLLGPRMTNVSLAWIGYKWGNDPKTIPSAKSLSSSDALKEDIEASEELSDNYFRLPSDSERKLGIDARTEATTAASTELLSQEPSTEELSFEERVLQGMAPVEAQEPPPAEPLPAESPPAELPRAEPPPAELSPIELPPPELPPAESPPTELPSAGLQPAEPLPAESSPAEPSPEERQPSEILPETGGGEEDDGRI